MRKLRGMTLVETLVSLGVSVLALGALQAMLQAGSQGWATMRALESAKQSLALTVGRIGPIVRSARRVEITNTTSARLTVVLPLVNAATGDYVVPLVDGDKVSFYLSDSTGAFDTTGAFLWRSVNGVPDTDWSLPNRRPSVDLGNAGLTFTLIPTTNPESVQVSVNTRRAAHLRSLNREVSTEIHLRNRRYH